MLTLGRAHERTIDTDAVAKLLDRPSLPTRKGQRLPSDRDFLGAVFEFAQKDSELAADLAAVVAHDEKIVSKFMRETIFDVSAIPARVAVGWRRGRRWIDAVVHGRDIHGSHPLHVNVSPVLVPQTRAQVLAYALALLIDVDRPYGRDLRRCQLEGCGAFFLLERTRGRARERYCSEQHMTEAQKPTASHRVMASRAGLTLEEFEKQRAAKRAKTAKARKAK